MNKLLKVKNFRRVMPKVCATCRHSDYSVDPGGVYCELEEDVILDTGDGDQWTMVCDYWMSPISSIKYVG